MDCRLRLAFFALADLLGMIVDAVAVWLAVDDDDDDGDGWNNQKFNKTSFTEVLWFCGDGSLWILRSIVDRRIDPN